MASGCRLVVVIASLSSLPACIVEGWAGAGAVRTPGPMAETRRVWTLGASFGFYLDPQRSRVRVGASTHTDKTYINAPGVTSTRSSGLASARVDVVLDPEPESDETLTRATGIVSWGAGATAVDIGGSPYPAAGTPAKAFLGLTRTIADRERRNQYFSDSLSYTVGPYVSRWSILNDPLDASAGGDTMWGFGGEVRITGAVSAVTVLNLLGAGIMASAELPNSGPGTARPTDGIKGRTCETTKVCTDNPDGTQTCVDSYSCR